VFVEIPKGFAQDGKVLRLKKSLYGLKQSPRNHLKNLSSKLEALGFVGSEADPCLFVSDMVICLVYVDDTLFYARDTADIDSAIAGLRALGMELEEESDVAGFLGVHIERRPDGSIQLTQQGLIQTNEVKSLDDEHTLDMFLAGCTYGPFFQNCSREGRKAGSTTAHKYKADSILSTLLGFERYPDFPGRKSTNALPKLVVTTRTILPRLSTRFNSMPSTLIVMALFQTLVLQTIRLLTRQLSLSI
jgi:hypothetical protein